nr:hypothetical protein [Tanacetum cinerariifolium]
MLVASFRIHVRWLTELAGCPYSRHRVFPDGCLCREIPAGSLFIRDGAATCVGSIGGVPSSHYLRGRKSGDVDAEHVGSNAGLCFLLATVWVSCTYFVVYEVG